MENDRLLNVMRDTIKQYVEANKTKNQKKVKRHKFGKRI